MKTRGVLYTCDRCGEEKFEEGYSALPIEWAWENFLNVDLCPACSTELDKQLKFFLKMDQYELDLTPYVKEVIENERLN